MGDHEKALQIEFDDITMKTKFFLTLFRSTLRFHATLIFHEKSFLNTILGYTSYWDYKPTNVIRADSSGLHTSDKL